MTDVPLRLVLSPWALFTPSTETIRSVIAGNVLPKPGWIALAAAAVSVVAKEILYQVTVKVGKEVDSPVTVANAWHHRSDAFSSIGSLLAIGGATAIRIRLTITVANVSNFPCPNSCSRSLAFEDMRMNTNTTTSLMRSESECTPSAIMAALCPNTPARIFNAVSTKFTTEPHNVTLVTRDSLSAA